MEVNSEDIAYLKRSKLIGFIFKTDVPGEEEKPEDERGGHYLQLWDFEGFDPTEFETKYEGYQNSSIGDGLISENHLSFDTVQFILRLVKSRITKNILSNKLRFNVLKRDNFTCQYCGRKPPEVILEVDHIIPISDGGETSLDNLITSCRECNRGKGKEGK